MDGTWNGALFVRPMFRQIAETRTSVVGELQRIFDAPKMHAQLESGRQRNDDQIYFCCDYHCDDLVVFYRFRRGHG
jgi:hypothetical protein